MCVGDPILKDQRAQVAARFDEQWWADAYDRDDVVAMPGWIGGIYCLAVEVVRLWWVGGRVGGRIGGRNYLIPVYVGRAVNVRNRLQLHGGTEVMPESRAHALWWQVADEVGGLPIIMTKRVASVPERARLEIEAIYALRPRGNRVDNCGRRYPMASSGSGARA